METSRNLTCFTRRWQAKAMGENYEGDLTILHLKRELQKAKLSKLETGMARNLQIIWTP